MLTAVCVLRASLLLHALPFHSCPAPACMRAGLRVLGRIHALVHAILHIRPLRLWAARLLLPAGAAPPTACVAGSGLCPASTSPR